MVVTCNTIGRNGRLGNQLFQVAAVYSLGYKSGLVPMIPKWDYAHYFEYQHDFLPYALAKSFIQLRQNGYHYSEFRGLNPNISYNLHGYFQSEKYFANVNVNTLFKPTQKTLDKVNSLYPILKESDCISLHVRRGDYLRLSEYHYNLESDYYHKAISMLPDLPILVMSDDKDYCKEIFADYKDRMYFCDTALDIYDLVAMTLCKHNIIANSTFSWWGAYLNQHKDKVVIAPDHKTKWFGKAYKNMLTKDVYPVTQKWIEI